MPTRLSLGSLSLVLDLTMKKGVGLPYTNWSEAEAAFLMSLRQGETSQHSCMKEHSSTARVADGIGVEICCPYVVGARQGLVFEQTDVML